MKAHRMGHWLSAVVAALMATGCATPPRNLGGANETIPVSFATANVQPGRSETGVFVFDEPQAVRVKVRQKPLLAIIDEVAYRKGFNYRILSDLTPFQVNLSAPPLSPPLPGEEAASEWERRRQVEFASERDLFDELARQVTTTALASRNVALRYRWTSDGPEFFLSPAGEGATVLCNERSEAAPACESPQIAFKKFFVRNVVVDDALRSIRTLFYKEITENSSADAPTPTINKDNPQNSTMVAYKPQNAIVMRSTDSSLIDKVSQSLFALDASYQQVLVETLIFQYDDSVSRRIGAALDYKREQISADGTKTMTSQITTLFGEGITSSLPQFFYGLSDTEKRATLLTRLSFFDRDGLTRVLAEPRLVLQSGESANVSLLTTKQVLTQGINTAGDIRQVNSGITFEITPTVLGNGKIRLKVKLTQSEFLPTNETAVVLSTNENKVETSIIAQDGEMVSIGGILSRRDGKYASGIPVLREIPGLGYLFGSRATDGSTSRIEFMIRPTVERVAQRMRGLQGNIEKTNLMIQREIDQKP